MKHNLITLFIACLVASASIAQQDTTLYPYSKMPDVFPGSKVLTLDGDLSVRMLDGAHRFIEKKIEQSATERTKLWKRDVSSAEAYERSIEPNRKRFMKYIGVVDKSLPLVSFNVGFPEKYPAPSMQKFANGNDQVLIAETAKYRVFQVRWTVFNRVFGEGLLLSRGISVVTTS